MLRPPRPGRRPPAATSAGIGLSDDARQQLLVDWRAPAAAAVLPGDGRRAAGRRAAPAPGHRAAARVVGIDDEVLDLDALERRRRRPSSPARGRCCAPSTRTGPGGCATSSPPSRREQDRVIRVAAGRRPGRPGRPRHRQDGGRPAPRGLPALHAPRAASPAAACWSSGRTRCSCATSSRSCPPRRDRRRAAHARAAVPRRRGDGGRAARGGGGQGRPADGGRARAARCGAGSARRPAPCPSTSRAT